MRIMVSGGETVMLTSLAEICKLFRVSRRTVRGWIGEGAPIARLGGNSGHRAFAHELQAWLVERTQKNRERLVDQALREVNGRA